MCRSQIRDGTVNEKESGGVKFRFKGRWLLLDWDGVLIKKRQQCVNHLDEARVTSSSKLMSVQRASKHVEFKEHLK